MAMGSATQPLAESLPKDSSASFVPKECPHLAESRCGLDKNGGPSPRPRRRTQLRWGSRSYSQPKVWLPPRHLQALPPPPHYVGSLPGQRERALLSGTDPERPPAVSRDQLLQEEAEPQISGGCLSKPSSGNKSKTLKPSAGRTWKNPTASVAL